MATRSQLNPAALIRAALFGGVLYLLSNEPQWYGLGLLAMAAVFSLVPLPRQA